MLTDLEGICNYVDFLKSGFVWWVSSLNNAHF